MRPRIGITSGRDPTDGKLRLSFDYVEGVRRAGGIALVLPPGEIEVEDLLALCDGVVMTGGGDVAPELYEGRPKPEIYGVDRMRDETEIALARAIVARRVPALCICRGMQVLAVAHGGSLVEHVPDEYGELVPHRGGDRFQRHDVRIEDGSRLARTLGMTTCSPASWHHQSVRAPGRDLRAVAWAEDGSIEALEHAAHDALWAVQWHPEHDAARAGRDARADDGGDEPACAREQQALFDAVVRAARAPA